MEPPKSLGWFSLIVTMVGDIRYPNPDIPKNIIDVKIIAKTPASKKIVDLFI